MSEKVKVIIVVLPKGDEIDANLPLEGTGEQIAKKMLTIKASNIPNKDLSGNTISYSLIYKRTGIVIGKSKLKDFGVKDNDVLILQPNIKAKDFGVVDCEKQITRPSVVLGSWLLTDYEVLRFLDWINIQYPEISILSSIPEQQVDKIIREYSTQMLNEATHIEFEKGIKKYLYEKSFSDNFFELIKDLFNKRKKQLDAIDVLTRYKLIKYHGIFIFPSIGSKFNELIETYWNEIHILTKAFIDIYYSENEVKSKLGYVSSFTRLLMKTCFLFRFQI
jgi:hypothetical protein